MTRSRCGFDAGKLIKGKKRHILVDMQGLLLHAIVHSAGVQDRDGGIWLLATLFGQFPFLAKLFADSAYAGSIFHTALAKVLPNIETEIVKRSDRAKGFVPLPKRWIVERTIAWLNRCRRLAKDCENLNRNALASSSSRQSASCYESFAILDKVSGRTLSTESAISTSDVTNMRFRPSLKV
jgi:putative transposase